MNRRTTLRIAAVAVGLGLAFVPAIAHASQSDIVPGSPCSTLGAVGYKHNVKYICEQKHGERCPFWHAQPHSGPHATPWSHGPCPACSPKPSHTTSPSPTATPTATSTPTPTATATETPTATGQGETPTTLPAGDSAGLGNTLAVTPGPSRGRIAATVGAGVAALMLGAALIRASRRRRTT